MAEGARRPGTLPRRRGGPHPQRAEHRRDEPLVRGPAGPRSRIPIRGSGPRHARTAGVPEGRRSAAGWIPRRDPPAPHGHAAGLRGRTGGGAAPRRHGRLRRNLGQRCQGRPVRTPVPLPRLHDARRRAEGRTQRDRRAPGRRTRHGSRDAGQTHAPRHRRRLLRSRRHLDLRHWRVRGHGLPRRRFRALEAARPVQRHDRDLRRIHRARRAVVPGRVEHRRRGR